MVWRGWRPNLSVSFGKKGLFGGGKMALLAGLNHPFRGGGRGGGGYLNNTLLANICTFDKPGPLGGDCRK